MCGHLKILTMLLALSFSFRPTASRVHFGSDNPYLHSEIVESSAFLSVIEQWPDEQKLIFELLNNYDSAVRPVYNASRSVGITFSLSLIQISDMVTLSCIRHFLGGNSHQFFSLYLLKG